jgi:DNA-binding NarL/FixJ family response regulator
MQTAVARLLSPSCDLVGRAPDIVTLFEDVVRLRPDLVLLDLSLPGGLNGLEVCRRLKAMTPAVSVVVFTGHDDAELRRVFLEAGASGFTSKLEAAYNLAATIHAVLAETARSAKGETA